MLNVEVRGAERRAPEYSACFHRAGEEVSVPVPEAGDWAAYYRNIADALLRGAELAVTPRSVLRVMKLREAAYISAETGRVVEWEI
jgi:predicted dehydrogenase